MKTEQFQKLITAATGRQLTIATDNDNEEIPLETKITVKRASGTKFAFEWKTPKKEDSLLRSFITAFCAKYREPDPDTYRDSFYGDTWPKYAASWNDPAKHDTCAAWSHHASHMLTPAKLRAQVEANFNGFTADMARLGFYPTLYGIGIFTIYGGQWVRDSLEAMSAHLSAHGVPYRNEMSDAGWVTRFVIELEKPQHAALLGSF